MASNRKQLIEQVLNELRATKFPKCASRKNVSSDIPECFVLGEVNYRGQAVLGGRTRGPSRWNKKFPHLLQACQDLIQTIHPEFPYTTIQVNKNLQCDPHVDKNNMGPSYIIGLGDYTGGELVIEGKAFNIRNRFKRFDGTKGHWVNDFQGERYSLVYFTHSFKPPPSNLRNITVSHNGLFNKGECIKSYD
jgi:hypothetical protein